MPTGAAKQTSKAAKTAKVTPFGDGSSMRCVGERKPFPGNIHPVHRGQIQKRNPHRTKLPVQTWGVFMTFPFPHIVNSEESAEPDIPIRKKSLTAFAGQAEKHVKSAISCESILDMPDSIPCDNDIYIAVSKCIAKMAVCSG